MSMRLQHTSEDLSEWVDKRRRLSESVCSKKYSFKVQNDRCSIAYRLFRRRIVQKNSAGAPAASTPLPTGGQQNTSFMLDTVRQRLWIDSPPRQHTDTDHVLCQSDAKAQTGVVSQFKRVTLPSHTSTSHRPLHKDNAAEPMMVWKPVGEDHAEINYPGTVMCLRSITWSGGVSCLSWTYKYNATLSHILHKAITSPWRQADNLQPFCVLSTQSESQMSLAAPSLLDDYYTNLLDCSCDGVVALALGSSVYFWNSETCALVGHLAPKLSPGQASSHSQTILSLCWSSDGKGLCIGNRRGDNELWDVEHGLSVKCLPSHQSAVRALSWKQNLVSSGSDLGHIQHYDPRVGALVGKASQQGALCSLQWSEDDQLASGSTEGVLHVWDSHINTHLQEPVTTMRQITSVKAMHWCPWQKHTIATGGGWKDGEVRIWDTKSRTCLTSVQTNSQVCCLRWTGDKKSLVTGHGVPHHHISSWRWDNPDLILTHQFSAHSKRVLHLALNKDGSQIFTAGADQSVNLWGM